MEKIYYNIEKFEIINSQEEIIKNLEEADILYDKLEFHKLHKKNAQKVYEINFIKKNNIIAKIYVGIKEKTACIPYSSPFSNIILKEDYKIETLDLVVKSLIRLKEDLNLQKIKITLPPSIYDIWSEEKISILLNNNFQIKYIDINNYFDLRKDINQDRSVKKDYNIALKNNLVLEKSSLKEAYEIIKQNREERGYPLRMTLEHLQEVEKKIVNEIRCYIVKKDEEKLASAIIFEVSKEIYQVIYWGNLEKYKNQKPMAYLANELVKIFSRENISILDIGPSSEYGEINQGLYQFKKNLGCKSCLKFSLEYKND